MKLLELFSGTHSIGKVALKKGIEVISLDRDMGGIEGIVHIKEDILTWDYKRSYPVGHFDIITASPVCMYWSILRYCRIGRKSLAINPDGSIVTRECLERDINTFGKPMVDKVFEIIDFFKPKSWWIENPQTGRMKHYINEIRPNIEWYDVDYCKYGFMYKKRTRFWTNIKDFVPKLCKKDCGSTIKFDGHTYHITNNGNTKIQSRVREHLKKINKGKVTEGKVTEGKVTEGKVTEGKVTTNKMERYRIPEMLIEELFDKI